MPAFFAHDARLAKCVKAVQSILDDRYLQDYFEEHLELCVKNPNDFDKFVGHLKFLCAQKPFCNSERIRVAMQDVLRCFDDNYILTLDLPKTVEEPKKEESNNAPNAEIGEMKTIMQQMMMSMQAFAAVMGSFNSAMPMTSGARAADGVSGAKVSDKVSGSKMFGHDLIGQGSDGGSGAPKKSVIFSGDSSSGSARSGMSSAASFAFSSSAASSAASSAFSSSAESSAASSAFSSSAASSAASSAFSSSAGFGMSSAARSAFSSSAALRPASSGSVSSASSGSVSSASSGSVSAASSGSVSSASSGSVSSASSGSVSSASSGSVSSASSGSVSSASSGSVSSASSGSVSSAASSVASFAPSTTSGSGFSGLFGLNPSSFSSKTLMDNFCFGSSAIFGSSASTLSTTSLFGNSSSGVLGSFGSASSASATTAQPSTAKRTLQVDQDLASAQLSSKKIRFEKDDAEPDEETDNENDLPFSNPPRGVTEFISATSNAESDNIYWTGVNPIDEKSSHEAAYTLCYGDRLEDVRVLTITDKNPTKKFIQIFCANEEDYEALLEYTLDEVKETNQQDTLMMYLAARILNKFSNRWEFCKLQRLPFPQTPWLFLSKANMVKFAKFPLNNPPA